MVALDRPLLQRIEQYESSGNVHLSLAGTQVSALVQKLRTDHPEYSRKKLVPFQKFVISHLKHLLGQRRKHQADADGIAEAMDESAGEVKQRGRKRNLSESSLTTMPMVDNNLLNQGLRASYKVTGSVSNGNGLKKKTSEQDSTHGTGIVVVTPENARFENFGALDHVLQPIYQCIYRLRNPHSFPRQKTFSGILLHGPPGCGKTLLAHAIANEAEVPILKVAAAELSTGTAVRSLFSDVEGLARCVVLVDEIDAIALRRDSARKDAECRILTQLMTCMDGLSHLWDANRDCAGHVIVIGTTNRPEVIDPALRRSGRFSIEIALEAPNEKARAQILAVLTRDMPIEGSRDFTQVARKTQGFVPADLFELTQQASFLAEQRRNASSGVLNSEDPWWRYVNTIKGEPTVLMQDFEKAVSQVQASMTREGFSSSPNISWEEVGGLNNVVEELKRCISRCISPSEMCKKLGVRTSAGFLLYGPPGCGKTLIAKAAASYAEANFISIKGPELLRKYLGDSEEQIRKLFKRARECPPCIICLDEIDSLCLERGAEGNTAVDRVVNQFLVEMDGIDELNGVIVIATTNRIDAIDEAFLRPGRLGNHIEIPLPDEESRVSILKALTRKKPLAAEVDLASVGMSGRLEGFSGSHLAELVEYACIAAIDEGLVEIFQRHFDVGLVKMERERKGRKPSYCQKRTRKFDRNLFKEVC